MELTFKIKDNAPAGEASVSVGTVEAWNAAEEAVNISTSSGGVTVEAPVHEHTWGEWTVTTAAACTEGGTETRTCTECGETETRTTEALGHDWDEWTVTTAATCEEKGVETRTCKHDASHTETRELAALGHDWDSGVVTKEATVEEEGVRTYTCKNDPSHTRTEVIAKLTPVSAPPTDNGSTESPTISTKPTDNGNTESPTVTTKPTVTAQPVQTAKPVDNTNRSDVPKTGNEDAAVLWFGMLLLCGAGAAVVVTRKRKEDR